MKRDPIIAQALELLACEAREADALASPDAVRDYLRLLLAGRRHEVFVVVFLDAQHRVIATEEMFRGTLTQTSVYPREVVIEALARNAAAVILCHNHPSGMPEPSRADLALTQTLRQTLALVIQQGSALPVLLGQQQRLLAQTAPSLYDMRNLFQVNVEEGRHLWAMVYLLHSYFGSDGREEAEELLQRRSGDVDKPRILTTFNEPISDWLSFFMFTTFTDRDGKYQLKSLAESAFDPLSRTCRFMLTEEAHHMFVGQTSVRRVIKRTCELMKEHNTDDVAKYGGINLDVLQKYTNFWYAASLDLFGNEVSSNAANYFAAGVKGRADERRYEDHIAKEGIYAMEVLAGGGISKEEIPLRNAMNEILRDDYIRDCTGVLTKWNAETKEMGVDFTFTLPSRRFHRKVGQWAEATFNPQGDLITQAEWDKQHDRWLPSVAERAHVQSLMKQVIEPGKMANWIAPPLKGVNDQPIAYEYVQL